MNLKEFREVIKCCNPQKRLAGALKLIYARGTRLNPFLTEKVIERETFEATNFNSRLGLQEK